jgi:hypothetical protein
VKPVPVAKEGPVALSDVQLKLQSNKELITELQPKLAGADVVGAAGGFKDMHQFVSAVFASHNMGLKFDALKAKLLNGKKTSLRQAIQDLRPAASAAIEAQRAQYDAAGTISAAERAAAANAASGTGAAKPAKATPSKAAPKAKESTEQK